MSKKIKIGIVGLGLAWERLHGPAYARLANKFEIAAVCDKDMNKAKSVAAFLNLPQQAAYGDCNAMLAEADIQAVDAMVPIEENFECAGVVIKSGKHLLAEKPFASSPEAARKLIRLRDQAKVKVMVAENFRYDEENILIKDLIGRNHIGNAVYFIDNNVSEFQSDMLNDAFARTEWRQHPKFPGGVLMDSGIHHIARQRFLFGNVKNIFAVGRPSEVDFAPYSAVNALLAFENNVAGHYSFFMIGKETQAPPVGLRIFGTGGEIYLENRECGYVNVSYKDGRHDVIRYTPGQGYYHELDNFHCALTEDKPIVSTPEKELGDIEVVFSMLASIEHNAALTPRDNLQAPQNTEEAPRPVRRTAAKSKSIAV